MPQVPGDEIIRVRKQKREPDLGPVALMVAMEKDLAAMRSHTGISGGAAYEVTVGRANLGRTHWDAFAVSLVIAVCAILIGGIFSAAQAFLARRNKSTQGGDK